MAILIAGVIIAGAILVTNSSATAGGSAPQGGGTAQDKLGSQFYAKLAADFGANAEQFASCMAEKTHQAAIDADTAEAMANGGRGTPLTFIYDTKTGKASAVSGAVPYAQFAEAVKNVSSAGQSVTLRPPSSNEHLVGSATAPVVLIEYSDYQCPFCRLVHPTIKRIVSESNGQVAWVYRHMPLTSIHPEAEPAANAAECITAQLGNEGFWKFTNAVFEG